MSNVSTIVKGIESAKKALGDLVFTTTLRKVGSSTYDSSTGKVTPAETLPTIEMSVTSFTFKEIDETNVRSDDLKGVIFTTSQVIDTEDVVVVGGIDYKIRAVQRHMAGNTLVAYEVHLRK